MDLRTGPPLSPLVPSRPVKLPSLPPVAVGASGPRASNKTSRARPPPLGNRSLREAPIPPSPSVPATAPAPHQGAVTTHPVQQKRCSQGRLPEKPPQAKGKHRKPRRNPRPPQPHAPAPCARTALPAPFHTSAPSTEELFRPRSRCKHPRSWRQRPPYKPYVKQRPGERALAPEQGPSPDSREGAPEPRFSERAPSHWVLWGAHRLSRVPLTRPA